jgi:hypothetical protein
MICVRRSYSSDCLHISSPKLMNEFRLNPMLSACIRSCLEKFWPYQQKDQTELNETEIVIKIFYQNRGVVPKFRWLVAGFPPRRPWFEPRSGHVGFMVDKVAWGTFPPSTSVSPANSHSTDCYTFIIIYHPGLVQ